MKEHGFNEKLWKCNDKRKKYYNLMTQIVKMQEAIQKENITQQYRTDFIEALNSITRLEGSIFPGCENLTVCCEAKKPLVGYPRGYDKSCFFGVGNIKWGW